MLDAASHLIDLMDEEMKIFIERLSSDEAAALYKSFFEKKR